MRTKLALLAAVTLAVAGTQASGVGLVITESPPPFSTVTDLTGFQTTGADMVGKLSVTAFFLGGGTETVPWTSAGPGSGIANGTLWSLFESGDTFNDVGSDGLWTLEAKSPNIQIIRLSLVGVAPGGTASEGTVFDRTIGGAFGTDGSFLGRDFVIESAEGAFDLLVTYVDEIDSLADGPGPRRDIWGQLVIDFTGGATAPAAFTQGNVLTFRQDTDTVGLRGPGPFIGPEFPEPTGAALAALLAVPGVLRRRRNH